MLRDKQERIDGVNRAFLDLKAREADCKALVQATVDAYGTIDVLINNAGYGPPASVLETTEELWDVTIAACLKSVYLMTRATVPIMLERGGGAIVNISSVAGKAGFENRSAYCAAKWGVHGFTEALRVELGNQNIRTHLICPGAVATPWWGTTNDAQPEEVLHRMVQPEEVADAVQWVLTKPERLQIDEVVIKTRRSPWQG
jgi:NAD(P)-dependent dehydrogenase (short-subunit alcohol dehydrogenase family)